MAAQRGDALLIKINTVAAPSTFVALGGLRTRSLTLNDETVDVTNSDSTGKWRELLPGAGVRSMECSGAGVLQAVAVEDSLQKHMNDRTFPGLEITVPGLGVFTGSFQITSLSYEGEHNGEATYSVSLMSAGPITYT